MPVTVKSGNGLVIGMVGGSVDINVGIGWLVSEGVEVCVAAGASVEAGIISG